jgi:hypothetical protein
VVDRQLPPRPVREGRPRRRQKYTDQVRPYAGGTRLERNWELTWHSLRHTFCTVALEDWKLPESTVCLLAGHSNSNSTRTRFIERRWRV